jgi:hypothetical protein
MEYYSAMKKNEILSFAGTEEHHAEWVYPGPEDQKLYVRPHMRTLDQGQTQQGDWTLITCWGESTQGTYEDRQETQKKTKRAFVALNAEKLKQIL